LSLSSASQADEFFPAVDKTFYLPTPLMELLRGARHAREVTPEKESENGYNAHRY
jgi:hypothetical protein